MQVVQNVKGSFRTTGSGHNREVVALYRWPLGQVPLYKNKNTTTCHMHHYPLHNLRTIHEKMMLKSLICESSEWSW